MDPLLIIIVLAVGAMFLLTSRTRKQQKQAVEFRQTLAIGDEVMTGSGLFGTVVDVDGDVITLESPSGARTDWLRAAIAKLATPPWAEADDDEGDEGDVPADESYEDEPELLPEDDLQRADRDETRAPTDAPGPRAHQVDEAAENRNGTPGEPRH